MLNFNGLSDTITCIKSLLKTKYPNFKAIIADNGSRIDEAKILSEEFKDKRLKFVRFPKNLGFSGGNNKILRKLKDKYVVLLNNDTEVTPNWLSPLIKILENNSKIAIVQPKILWLTNKKYFDYAGACGGFIDIFGYPFTRGRIFDTKERDRGQYDTITDIFWASGAAMAIRRSIFDKVGYLDERFFNYMEEIDLCFRIHRTGFRVVCNPKSVIYHKGAASSAGNQMKKRYWEHKNSLLLLAKNYPISKLIYILPIRIFLEYVSLVYYLFNMQFSYALSVVLSQISLLRITPSIIFKNNISDKQIVNRDLILNKSIVLDYFIFNKNKFSQLKIL